MPQANSRPTPPRAQRPQVELIMLKIMPDYGQVLRLPARVFRLRRTASN
jgi:hypothetical protein